MLGGGHHQPGVRFGQVREIAGRADRLFEFQTLQIDRIFVDPIDRGDDVILHIRRADSPWGRHTVWFRDWLRAHPAERLRYEQTKRRLSEQNAGKADYDDYTQAKSAFFDDVWRSFVAWAGRDEHGS